jgi:hypothetical protein
MKTSVKIALLVVATLGVAGGTVHLFLPGGLPAAIEKALASHQEKPKAPPTTTTEERPAPPSGDSELKTAERAFDAGDFSKAVDGFLAARADADPDYRERAERGLRKAILAWALTVNAAPPEEKAQDVDAEIARRQKQAETTPSEQAWYDVTMYAAGCGASKKLPFLAQQAISSALRDGPVEIRLKKVLERAGSRTTLLKDVMTTEGFLDKEVVDPVAVAAAPRPDGAKAPALNTPRKAPVSMPVGKFTKPTLTKLEQAIDLEKKGAIEYDLCGPDNAQRKEHRKAALDYLKQARDIYQAAQDEDPDSPSLGRRLQQVMEMISHLHKESNLGE